MTQSVYLQPVDVNNISLVNINNIMLKIEFLNVRVCGTLKYGAPCEDSVLLEV